MQAQRGMTLIELMIVVMIIAILISIGYPSYLSHAERARRSDGTTALNRASMVMESCRSDLATYTACDGRVNATSEEGYYNVGVVITGGGTGYNLTATAVGGQADDGKCATLTLNSAGTRGYTGSASGVSVCWGG